MDVRALLPEDAAAARALVVGQFGGTRYHARLSELLTSALGDASCVGTVCVAGEGLRALMLHERIAGTKAAVRIDWIGGDHATAVHLARTSCSLLARDSLVIAEIPDDAPYEPMAAVLSRLGFAVECEIVDYVADGIALRIVTTGPP